MEQSRKTLLLIFLGSLAGLALILVGLLAVYLFIRSQTNVTVGIEAFVQLDTSRVDGIGINGKNGHIFLKKTANNWQMKQPVQYPAEARFVHDLLKVVSGLENEGVISENAEKDSVFQVDAAGGTDFSLLSGADTLAHFIVGKLASTGTHTYVKPLGENKVYLIKGVLSSHLNRRSRDWRAKQLLDIPSESMTRIEYQYPKESFALVRTDSTTWNLEKGGKSTPADQKSVGYITSALGKLKTFDFVDGDSAAMVDFSRPDLTVTINTDAGGAFQLALVPQDSTANRYYVRKEGIASTLFVIHKGTANQFMKKPEDFKEKK